MIAMAVRPESKFLKKLAVLLTMLLAITTILSQVASAQAVVVGGAGGAYYKFAVPANWNGDLVLWNGGYILVAPMGYNSGGWYGIPVGAPRGNRGPGDGTNPAATPPRGNGAGRGFNSTVGGTAVTDPAKVRELSEKDVMNVLDMIRKEFNVDERRTYLMGHSMGGAGTLYLGVK